MTGRSPFEVLGVEPEASRAEIDAAYRRLAAQLHPDRHADAGVDGVRDAIRRTAELNAAHAALRNPVRAEAARRKLRPADLAEIGPSMPLRGRRVREESTSPLARLRDAVRRSA